MVAIFKPVLFLLSGKPDYFFLKLAVLIESHVSPGGKSPKQPFLSSFVAGDTISSLGFKVKLSLRQQRHVMWYIILHSVSVICL